MAVVVGLGVLLGLFLLIVRILALALPGADVHLEVCVRAEDWTDVGPFAAYALLEVGEGTRRLINL